MTGKLVDKNAYSDWFARLPRDTILTDPLPEPLV
jgi:hypothetical protein